MQNIIERSIRIQASKAAIYAALTEADKLTQWFPSSVEGDLTPGSQPLFGFGEHGKSRVSIVAAEPHHYFAYRWVPGANHCEGDVSLVATTLVEFRISEAEGGFCEVKVTESGFNELPADIKADAFKQNNQGWDYMVNRLEQLFTEAA
ncbi:SRPBCC family protein [Marinicella sediminis]|uniref:SRPBCC family protein n=1 Tax=Marinicella sediminis TaxID=1792834 RepID=A0ABV7J8R2_9GAMM|nr:SRPBCC family protein [Marinicella sediminis]